MGYYKEMREANGQKGKRRNAAIFDLDHTISTHDTYLQFLLRYLRAYPLRVLRCLGLPAAVGMHKLKLRDNSWLKEKFLTAIAGGTGRGRIQRFSARFVEKTLASGLYPLALERIDWHRERSDYLMLASASFDFYVEPLAKRLGFDAVVCTRARWDGADRLTGRIAGDNCYGQHKKVAIQRALEPLAPFDEITVYSDHHSDLPTFSLASRKVAVNPTPKLLEIAAGNEYSLLRW